ncbi:hypothetical protein RI367_002731 [Sorochytrium milnesiophthora]
MAQDTAVLEEVYDPDYEPTEEEIQEYAEFLGLDVENESALLWIAREGLKAPLPPAWKPCQTDKGEVYYYNFDTKESIWDHPCDDYYKKLYEKEKEKLQQGGASAKSAVTPIPLHPLKKSRSQNASGESLKELAKPKDVSPVLLGIAQRNKPLPLLETGPEKERLLSRGLTPLLTTSPSAAPAGSKPAAPRAESPVMPPRSRQGSAAGLSRSSSGRSDRRLRTGSNNKESEGSLASAASSPGRSASSASSGNTAMKQNLRRSNAVKSPHGLSRSNSSLTGSADRVTANKKHEAALADLESRHREELLAKKRALDAEYAQMVSDLRKQHEVEVAKVKTETEHALEAERTKQRSQLDQATADAERDTQVALSQLKQQHRQTLEQERRKADEELNSLRQTWSQDRDKLQAQLLAERAAFEAQSTDSRSKWTAVASDVDRGFVQRRKELEAQHEADLETLRERLADEKAQWEGRTREMNDTYAATLRQTEETWRRKVAATEASHEQKMQLLAAEHEARAKHSVDTPPRSDDSIVSKLHSTIEELQSDVARLQHDNERLRMLVSEQERREVATTAREVQCAEAEELDRRIEHLRRTQHAATGTENLAVPAEAGPMSYQELESVANESEPDSAPSVPHKRPSHRAIRPTHVSDIPTSASLDFEQQIEWEKQKLERAKSLLSRAERDDADIDAAAMSDPGKSYLRDMASSSDEADGEGLRVTTQLGKTKRSRRSDRAHRSVADDGAHDIMLDELEADIARLLSKVQETHRSSGSSSGGSGASRGKYSRPRPRRQRSSSPRAMYVRHRARVTAAVPSPTKALPTPTITAMDVDAALPRKASLHNYTTTAPAMSERHSLWNRPPWLASLFTRPVLGGSSSSYTAVPTHHTATRDSMHRDIDEFGQDCRSASARLQEHSTWLRNFVGSLERSPTRLGH